MLIKLTDFSDELAEKLKAYTGQSTGSKAVNHAAGHYLTLVDILAGFEDQFKDLQAENVRLRAVIARARSAAADLLDSTTLANPTPH
jgi:hypothetical protein